MRQYNEKSKIGGRLRDRLVREGLQELADALEDDNLAAYYIYLFYPESKMRDIAMPRWVLKKLYVQLQSYSATLEALGPLSDSGYNYKSLHDFILLIQMYFNGVVNVEMWTPTGPDPTPWDINLGWMAQASSSVWWQIESQKPLRIELNDSRLDPFIEGNYFKLSPKSLTVFYEMLWTSGGLKDHEYTNMIRQAYTRFSTSLGRPSVYPQSVINKAFDELPARAWVVGGAVQWAELENGQWLYNLPTPDAAFDCNVQGMLFERMIPSASGPTYILRATNMDYTTSTFSSLNIAPKVGDRIKFYDNFSADGGTQFTIDYVHDDDRTISVTRDNKALPIIPGGSPSLPLTYGKFVDCSPAIDPSVANREHAIIWLELQDFQYSAYSNDPWTPYPGGKMFFIEPVMFTHESGAMLTGWHKVAGVIRDGDYVGLVLWYNQDFTDKLESQTWVGTVWPAEKELGPAKLVNNIQKWNNGTFSGGPRAALPSAQIKYDPDGIVEGYYTTTKPYDQEDAVISGPRIGEVATIIAGVVAAVTAVVGMVLAIIEATRAAKVDGVLEGYPQPECNDFDQSNVVWSDESDCWKIMEKCSGQWYCMDESGNIIGPTTPPVGDGSSSSIVPLVGAGLLLGAAVMSEDDKK